MSGKKNILVLTQWSYKDALIQAYTLPYVKIIAKYLPEGSKIYLVTFEQKSHKIQQSELKEIKYELEENGIHLLNFSYSTFGIISLIKYSFAFFSLLFVIFTKKIKFIHAWCTPAGALGFALSIFTGKPLIIDSYEPHAEAMVENKTWNKNSFKYRLLFYFEKKQSQRAKTIISTTEGMKDYALKKYGVDLDNFYVKPACTDMKIFSINKKKDKNLSAELQTINKIVCVYAGKFGGIYLSKEVFDFFRESEKKWGDKFRALLLTPTPKEELNKLAKDSGFDPTKMIVRFVDHKDISRYMGLGDFAITPVKPIPTKKYCTPIKDGEYWGLGLPVVITAGISDDSEIIEKFNAGAVIKELTTSGYKNAIDKIELLLNDETTALRIHNIAEKYRSFEIADKIYKSIYGAIH